MQKIIYPELLAPAGDFERLIEAVRYGADAVYLAGLSFGMRAAPPNFTSDQLSDAVKFCHENGVRVYQTCNTLPLPEETDSLPEFIADAVAAKVDALIVADIGIMMLAKRLAPNLEIHISTQAGVVNQITATELYNLGAARVVLARELSLEQIKVIRDKTPPKLEIEAFVHGAMCVSFSGRCLLSNYLVSRDGNRGECAQPCRWGYHLMEEKRPGLYFPIFEDEHGSHILNARDMCMIEHIDKLAVAGISSFKIEGRAKSSYYVAAITNAYRIAIDTYLANPENFSLPNWLSEEVGKVSHREYSTGFFFDTPSQCYSDGGYIRNWEVVAAVTGYENGFLVCSERNKFSTGDSLEFLQPGKTPEILNNIEIFDETTEKLESANHPMMKLLIPYSGQPCSFGLLRKRLN